MMETDKEPQDLEDDEAEAEDSDFDDDLELEDFDEDDDEAEEDDEALLDDDEESGSASLDELLAQRAAARVGTDDSDEDDIMSLTSEASDQVGEPLVTRVLPMKRRQEFVCSRCRLVKSKSQLADAQRGLCRDCV